MEVFCRIVDVIKEVVGWVWVLVVKGEDGGLAV